MSDEPQKAEQETEPTPTESKGPSFIDRLKRHLKAWPKEAMDLVLSPQPSIKVLPAEGDWEAPLVYGTCAGLLVGIVQAFWMLNVSAGMAIGNIFTSIVTGFLGIPIFAFVLNLILSLFGKEPGTYRTARFLALISIAAPLTVLLALIAPFLSIAPYLVVLYLLYQYANVAAGMTKKKSLIFVGVLLGIGLLGALMFGLSMFALVAGNS